MLKQAMFGIKLRAAQQEALKYVDKNAPGKMAISAVPGSGKTTTIAVLAAKLVAGNKLKPHQQVLVVTYQKAAVENVRARISRFLRANNLLSVGFHVSTLHSLANAILRENPTLIGADSSFTILDEQASNRMKDTAIRAWNEKYPKIWQGLCPDNFKFDKWEKEWTKTIRKIASTVITAAKNHRIPPADLEKRLSENPETYSPMLRIASQIYTAYQKQVKTAGAFDYNDLTWKAVELLAENPDVLARISHRFPYILEDEAQDSTPLQEEMLSMIAGGSISAKSGNWVRVGDPNQAIMSTFTSADPKFLNDFILHDDVFTITLDQAGRSSQNIITVANELVRQIGHEHPDLKVQEGTFRNQMIQPVGENDPQQNPKTNSGFGIGFKSYTIDSDEQNDIVRRVVKALNHDPEATIGILVATNNIGYQIAARLREAGVKFDEMLQGTVTSREVAEILAEVLSFMADPLGKNALVSVYDALLRGLPALKSDPETGEDLSKNIRTYLRSCNRPESLLYPDLDQKASDALPKRATDVEIKLIEVVCAKLRRWMRAISLPVDQIVMTVSQDLFEEERMVTAQVVASVMKSWRELNPDWRLGDLARSLKDGDAGKLVSLTEDSGSFEPAGGVPTLTTMHKAKGLEWDIVFVPGLNSEWLPWRLEDKFWGIKKWFDGNPEEETRSELLALFDDSRSSAESATDRGKRNTISERLRLFYVAITRARKFLALSYAQSVTTPWGKTQSVQEAIILRRLNKFVREQKGKAR